MSLEKELEDLERQRDELAKRIESAGEDEDKPLGEWFEINDKIKEIKAELDLSPSEDPAPVGRPIEYQDEWHRKRREAAKRWYYRHRQKLLSGEYESTGKRKIYCKEEGCGETFTHRTSYVNHMLIVHGKKVK